MRVLNVGIAGLGVVGAEVAKLLLSRAALMSDKAGAELHVTAVSARSRGKDRGFSIDNIAFVDNPVDLASRTDVDIVIELMGGADGPALQLARETLQAGKSFVTANKAMIAEHGQELAELAEASDAALVFEAAVAGGIPALKTLREGLAANQITRVSGILNGTCNYILSEMSETGRDFEAVLKEAQEKGYAEADPTFDVDGIDAAHKLAILSSLAFGHQVNMANVDIQGIRAITDIDISYAAELGYTIKLLGIAAQGQKPTVKPCLLPSSSQLAKISGALNAVEFDADPVQTVICVGPGAGAGPTASAVLADVIDVASGRGGLPFGRPTGRLSTQAENNAPSGYQRYYIRLTVADRPGVLSEITSVLRDADISVATMLQKSQSADTPVSLVLTTHRTTQPAILAAVAQLEQMSTVYGPALALAILDVDLG